MTTTAGGLILGSGPERIHLAAGDPWAWQGLEPGTPEGLATGYAAAFVDGEGLDIGLGLCSDGGILARFVQFADVAPAAAVVEVGAGTGLLTFEGGLADVVGADGVVVATDPAVPLLRVLQRKSARAFACPVHVLCARAENLPIADAQAGVTLGSRFLHYCDAPRAVAEMARVTRGGGTVAVLAMLAPGVSAGWNRVLGPLRAAARRYGGARAERGVYSAPGDTAETFAAAGLTAVTTETVRHEVDLPEFSTTLRLISQISALEGFVEGLPAPLANTLLDRAYRDLRAMFALRAPAERRVTLHYEFVRGIAPFR